MNHLAISHHSLFETSKHYSTMYNFLICAYTYLISLSLHILLLTLTVYFPVDNQFLINETVK